MKALSEEQKRANVTAVLRRATEIIEKNKADAVKRGDFEQSIGIASRQAEIEAYFRDKGVILL